MNAEPLEIDWMPIASSLLLTVVYLWLVINHARQEQSEKTAVKEDPIPEQLILEHSV